MYVFSVCFENAKGFPGLITEKIFHCFNAGSIPIYFGASNIEKHIPEDCFINYENFKSIKDMYDYIKHLKHGYSLVTDHATRELRLNRLSRKEGISLIKKYSNIYPKDMDLFVKWLGISSQEFLHFLEKARNKKQTELQTRQIALREKARKLQPDGG